MDRSCVAVVFFVLLPGWSAVAGEDPLADWHKSCEAPSADGLCVRPGEADLKKKTSRCGDGSVLPLERVKRSRKMAQRALAKLKASEGAEERFRVADDLMEEYIAVRFPSRLNFGSKKPREAKASKERFAAYLQEKGKNLRLTRDAYLEVSKLKAAPWAAASRVRVGQLFLGFALDLISAPIPRAPVPRMLDKEAAAEFSRRFNKTFCETLWDKARPLLDKAGEAVDLCKGEVWHDSGCWRRSCGVVQARLARARASIKVINKRPPPTAPPDEEERVALGAELLLPTAWPPAARSTACTFKAKAWSPPRPPKRAPAGADVAFVRLDDAVDPAAKVTLPTGSGGLALVALEKDGVVLHGTLRGRSLLHPARPLPVNKVVFTGPRAPLRWLSGEAGRLEVGIPRPAANLRVRKPAARLQVACKDLDLVPGDREAFYRAMGVKPGAEAKWVSFKRRVPVAPRPGARALAHIPKSERIPEMDVDGVDLHVLASNDKSSRVLFHQGDEMLVGWVATRALGRKGNPLGMLVGMPEARKPRPGGIKCPVDLPLFAQAGSRTARVGTVRKGTPIMDPRPRDPNGIPLDQMLLGGGKRQPGEAARLDAAKWIEVALPAARWFDVNKGARLMVEIGARELCPGL